MKLNQDNNITTIIGEVNKNEVGFSPSKANKAIMLLTSKLYSEPINSFIREICSNAWDSHAEAGTDEPIILTLDRDKLDKDYILVSIRDFGTGLSPERFESVYRFLGETTKEDSNDYIGAYGLGKFSPLSVVDMVPITSFYNGIKYSYLMYKNGMGINIDTVESTETNEKNGLLVEVRIKKSHLGNVYSAISSQLQFFDTIFFNDNIDSFSRLKRLNASKIKHYNSFSISEFKTDNSISILNGKVEYELNINALWDLIPNHIDLLKMMQYIGVALRFNIGELDLVPSRESLHYTEKTLNAIITRLEETRDEIIDLRIGQLHNGQIKSEHLKDLPSNDKMDLDDLTEIIIGTLPIKVNFEGKEVLYKDLYDSVGSILSLGVNFGSWTLNNKRILKCTYSDLIIKFFKYNLGIFQPSFTNIQKKYLRQSLKDGSILREEWTSISSPDEIKKTIVNSAVESKKFLNPLDISIIQGLSKELSLLFKSVSEADFSGVTPEFIAECRPKKRVSTKISCLVIGPSSRQRISLSLEEISLRGPIVIATSNSDLLVPYDDKKTLIYKVAKTNIPKLLELNNTISEVEYLKTLTSRILYENEIYESVKLITYHKINLFYSLKELIELPKEILDVIYYRLNQEDLQLIHLSHYLPSDTSFDRITKIVDQYSYGLSVLDAFNLKNNLGKKWAREKLKELGHKLLT